MWYIQASAWEKIPLFSKFCSHQTASSGFAACLWHLLRAKVVLHFSEDTQKHHWSCCLKWYIWAPHFHFSMRALQFTVIPGKSDIREVTGFITASGRCRMLIWFSSGITGALFSASSPCQRSFYCIFKCFLIVPITIILYIDTKKPCLSILNFHLQQRNLKMKPRPPKTPTR